MERPAKMSALNPSKKRKRKIGDGDVGPEGKVRRRRCVTAKPVRQEAGDESTEHRIWEFSSSVNTSSADFKKKYIKLYPIGVGGFGSVYAGLRISDCFRVAIKYIPIGKVSRQKVKSQGKTFDVIMEVALMLKAAGLPGSSGQSAAVSLLDLYLLDQQLILVMERPQCCMSLYSYLKQQGGSLTEHEAKMILKQLVDAAVDLHSKGVFHRDIKLQNVLVSLVGGQPRVHVVDFGCGTFSTEASYHHLCGTKIYFPPEWFCIQTYWARPTTVWQLGALFYSLLKGHRNFSTEDFLEHNIGINPSLSTEVKSLLDMCLNRNPYKRVLLTELQFHPALTELSRPPTQSHVINDPETAG